MAKYKVNKIFFIEKLIELYLKNKFLFFRFVFCLIFFKFSANAQDTLVDQSKKQAKEQTLDFNANVIEGEVKRPQLFLELGTVVDEFNSVILSRDDFNDYHEVDMKNRLKYIDSEK